MPGFNQNGPMGQGAMTGRKMGKCTNFGANRKSAISENELEANSQTGNVQGFGCRRGGARGMGRRNRK